MVPPNVTPEARPEAESTEAMADDRLPYEPPRVEKKRSVARATLFTAMGPMGGGLTMTSG